MTARDLYLCIGEVDDALLEEAAEIRRKPRWLGIAALAACAALVIALPVIAGLGLPQKSAETADASGALWEEAEMEAAPESAEMKNDATSEAAAPEAPASEPETVDGSGAMQEVGEAALLLSVRLGDLQLGMTGEQVRAQLGEPDLTSNSGAVLYDDGFWRICWFYNTANDPERLSDANLTFTKADGSEEDWVLSEIMVSGSCTWTLDNGLGLGSSRQEILAAYPDAQESDDGICSLQDGNLFLTFDTRTGFAEHITLGGLNEYRLIPEAEQAPVDPYPYTFTPYQTFCGETVTAYTRTGAGWEKTSLTGPQAKHIVTALNIMEPEWVDTPCQAALWLVFDTGAAALGGEDGSAAIYHIEDAQALARALDAGEDPSAALTLIGYCVFPEAWDEVHEAFTLPAQW